MRATQRDQLFRRIAVRDNSADDMCLPADAWPSIELRRCGLISKGLCA
jgi:hypothetical protein